jgi:selenocysteine lyase/cysteine desulfurase/intein/homing endonuclease
LLESTKTVDVERVRNDFPIMNRKVNGKPLVYLDNAATTQKPKVVIDALVDYYSRYNANVHRGVHQLSIEATETYENSRKKLSKFINSPTSQEVVFTRGTTESINLVKFAWGSKFVKEGDVILLTLMEHHSNMVPWQLLAKEKGARVEYAPITADGRLDIGEFERLLGLSPKLVAFTHCSNVLGTINDAEKLCAMAKSAGATTLIDAAQSAPHMPLDVQKLGCDFLAFSVTGDTPVLVRHDGTTELVPIEEAVELYNRGSVMSVLTLGSDARARFETVKGTLAHLDGVYEVQYEDSALPVRATGHHSVYVWRDSNIIEEKVSRLQKGDYLVTLSKQSQNPFERVDEAPLEYTHDGNSVKEKVRLTKELMRLIGYYLAEGSLDSRENRVSLTFAETETELVNDACTLIEALDPMLYHVKAMQEVISTGGGLSLARIAEASGVSRKTAKKYSAQTGPGGLARTRKIRPHVWRNNQNHTANISFNDEKWFSFFKVFCGSRIDKHLPGFVWQIDVELVAELLKGYLRGDASKNEKYRLRVKSVSKRLITELSWLLKLHGISSTLGFEESRVEGWHDEWSLVIQRSELKSAREFRRQTSKPDAPRDKLLCVDGLKRAYRRTSPRYNSRVSSTLRHATKRATRAGVLNAIDWIKSSHRLPIDEETKEMLSKYETFALGDFGLVKVTGVRPAGEHMVYDISVEGSERFFGGYYPVLLHNSGHKMLGPTGIGVLYGRRALLDSMDPFQSGGDMIKEVHLDGARWNDVPYKFEAGTTNIADAIGLGVAVEYLSALGMDNVRRHEVELLRYAFEKMSRMQNLALYGPMDLELRGGVISFNIADIHPHDMASILDEEGVAIRSGHHCAQPLMDHLNVPGTSRASFYVYNSTADVDAFIGALLKAKSVFCV